MSDERVYDAVMQANEFCPGCNCPTISCRCRQVEKVAGVGPDQPLVTNKRGGKQSYLPYRFDLLPPRAVLAVAKVFATGAKKYTVDNWRLITQTDHLNHTLAHILAYMAKDDQDDHLEHAAARLLMALETTDQ